MLKIQLASQKNANNRNINISICNSHNSTREPAIRVVGVDNDISDIVDPTDLEGVHKHARKTKEERLASVMAGREGRHFGSKKGMRDDKPTTNKEKLSSKPFMLVRYSKEIQKKKNRTTREKQKARRQHSVNQKNQLKYKH
jgi:protein SDA1